MASITSLHHTGIQVRDLDRSLEFYLGVLGFDLLFRWNPQAPYISELVGYPGVDLHSAIIRMPDSDVFLELLEYGNVAGEPVDTRTGNPGTAHIAFMVDDLDVLFADLVSKGVDFVSEPVTPTIGPNAGGRAVYMMDPDGFRIEFMQSSRTFGEYTSGDAAHKASD